MLLVPDIDLVSHLLLQYALVGLTVLLVAWGISRLARRQFSLWLALFAVWLVVGAPVFATWYGSLQWGLVIDQKSFWALAFLYVFCTIVVVVNSFVAMQKHRRFHYEHPGTFEVAVSEPAREDGSVSG